MNTKTNKSEETRREKPKTHEMFDNREFKLPESRRNRRRNSRRENSYDRRGSSRNASRESSFDRHRKSSTSEHENWREEIRLRQQRENARSRQNSERETENFPVRKGGIIVLPPEENKQWGLNPGVKTKFPEMDRKSLSPGQKSLFDPNNPNKPIIVKSVTSRNNVPVPGFTGSDINEPPVLYTKDQFGNIRPGWYNENSEGWKMCHFPEVLKDVKRADTELQYIINSGQLLISWGNVVIYRNILMECLDFLLLRDLKFSQAENIEQHFWKILYYNIIEMMRKAISFDPENKERYKSFLMALIDEGTKYFENLLNRLEIAYDFKLSNYLGSNCSLQSGLGYTGLALISSQKIFLFLGDLGRYKEQVNESSNYGKCRVWYIKANEINPKNGKPYNQLAVLAVYAVSWF